MPLPKLSEKPVKEEYIKYRGKVCQFGGSKVKVDIYRSESRQGSWERGFKFVTVKYGELQRVTDKKYSYNHGKTWQFFAKPDRGVKGKVRIDKDVDKEFAFEGIQEINRRWDPGYKWHK
jgi:hypothetical protein